MTIRNIIYVFTYLIAVIIGMIVIHEAAHLVAALAVGVPFNEITVGFIKGNPGMTIHIDLNNTQLSVIFYSGGLAAAVVLISIYFLIWFRRYLLKPSRLVWILGFITLGLGAEEIGNAIVEGRFHAVYIYYANSPFGLGNFMIIIYAILGFILHALIFLLLRYKKNSGHVSNTRSG